MGNVEKNELKIIFQKMRNGDESGIELLYKNYYSMIYGIAYSILKNKENSEDIVHNVFTKLMKMDKNLLPSKGESSWLYIVTKNEVMQFLRSQKVNIDIDDMYTIEAENNEIEDYIDMTSFHKLLEKLDPIDREIVSLRIISDFTFDRISQLLNIPIGTVQWKYYRALHDIKKALASVVSFFIVFGILEVLKQNMIEKANENVSDIAVSKDKEGKSSEENTVDSWKSEFSNEGMSFGEITSSDSIKESASDITGASGSIESKLFITILTIIIFIVFTILIIYSFVHKKVRIKKKNKKI